MRTALLEFSPRAKWSAAVESAASVLRSFTLSVDPDGSFKAGLDVGAAEGFADHGDLSSDLTDLLLSLGEAAVAHERGVVLLFDEIQFLGPTQREAIIQALHKLIQRKLPVTLGGAGLPQIAELAGDAKSYAERLLKFPIIGNLSAADAARALAEPAAGEGAHFEEAAIAEAPVITGGYPYFIQELGHAVWPLAPNDTVTLEDIRAAQPIYESKLDSSFFRVRLDRATENQRAYLRAMAGLGDDPQKASDVATALGRNSTQVAPFRAELINMGLSYTPEHGYAAFTVPHFDQFMLRVQPRLVLPPPRRRGRGRGDTHADLKLPRRRIYPAPGLSGSWGASGSRCTAAPSAPAIVARHPALAGARQTTVKDRHGHADTG